MKLHNTITRQTEEFEPLKDGEVSLYTCGPTVYSYYHIGNLRNAVFNDTLRRALEANGYKTKHVMNITDVGHLVSDDDEGEDKLEKGAARENKTVWEVADYYIGAFENDMKKLNVLPPNGYQGQHGPYARATDFIDQQIELIKTLLDKGFAYQTEQAIYFDVSKLSDYGKLSGQNLDDKEVGARSDVVTDQHKHHPQDFSIWFFTAGRFADHAMHWPSPWGEGFPGWHLECSAIIHATLGEPIDIHTGGVDHIGTHHTNEIAQTEAAYGTKLANYWVHNEHLMVDGRKMAKSGDNYLKLKEIIDQDIDPLALRLLYLQAHYRTQMNFTWDSLRAAAVFLKRLQAWADLKFQMDASSNDWNMDPLIKDVSDDLNTPSALAKLAQHIDESSAPSQELLDRLEQLFGLGLAERSDVSDDIKELINKRQHARDDKNWTESDNLRQELVGKGVEVNDSGSGPIWSRL